MSKVHCLIILPDSEENPEGGKAWFDLIEPTLQGIKEHVCPDGGYIEAINSTTDEFGRWHAYIDDEGKNKSLPINWTATAVARKLGWRPWPLGDVLAGPVVFLGNSPTDAADEGDFPPEATAYVIRLFGGFTTPEE